jgi:hypothetical protein
MLVAKNTEKRRPRTPPKSKPSGKSTNSCFSFQKFEASEQPARNPLSTTHQDLSSASTVLRQLINIPATKDLLDPELRINSQKVYTNGVTIWMLILQRLCKGATLVETVSHVLEHDRDLLPENKRVRDHTLSESSSGFSAARNRLTVEDVHAFSHAVCDYLGKTAQPIIDSRRVFMIDGTTITLAPTPELGKAFPPATNQHGESVWPVAMLMVAVEMQTGCALLPQIDPMYGPDRTSEAKQSAEIIKQLPENSIVMADSGFGIYSVAYHSTRAGHDFLFRLTKSRFSSMFKKATLVESGDGYSSYALTWKPSPKDRKSNPDLPKVTTLQVVLHCIKLDNGESLYLVTSLEIDALSAAQLYSRRYDIEFDIRDMKVTMDAENIRARSVEMMQKELMASVIAFNLVMQFRRQAATLARVEPRRLSFKGCWTSFKDHLLLKTEEDFESWEVRYARALVSASKRKLPNRNKPRSYPRKAHPRRPKSTKFMKAEAKKAANQTAPPPLLESK